MKLSALEGAYSVYRFGPDSTVPDNLHTLRGFVSVTRTSEELSIVCPSGLLPGAEREEGGWKLWKVRGPLEFSLTGVLSAIAAPLAEAGVSIFAVSTFDTDYILWKEESSERAEEALRNAGFEI